MKWIKHFTNAHKGSVLQELYAEFGVNTGHGLYWRFLEYVGDKWDGRAEPRFQILELELRKFLGLSKSRFNSFRTVIESVPENKFEISGKFCEIYLPKLLEIRHRDALNASTRQALGQLKSGGEGEEKRIDEKKRENASSFATLLKKIAIITSDGWNQKYGKDFVAEWGPEAVGYWSNQPGSATWTPMQWASKISGSLARQKAFEEQQAEQSIKGGAGDICGIAEG